MLPQTPYFCCCKISKYFPPHDLNQKMRNVERIINKKLNIPIHVRGGLANTEQGLTHAHTGAYRRGQADFRSFK